MLMPKTLDFVLSLFGGDLRNLEFAGGFHFVQIRLGIVVHRAQSHGSL